MTADISHSGKFVPHVMTAYSRREFGFCHLQKDDHVLRCRRGFYHGGYHQAATGRLAAGKHGHLASDVQSSSDSATMKSHHQYSDVVRGHRLASELPEGLPRCL